jgi:hypothetical protein
MNPSKSGLSSAGKTGIVVALVLVVLGAAYLAPSMLTGGGTNTTSSQPAGSSANPGSSTQAIGILSLFGSFSQMQLQNTFNSQANGPQQRSVAYLVLGKASLNSTLHTKVEFSTVGAGHNVVVWFNSTGGIDRVDVLGDRNYTGSGAYLLPMAQTYVTAFGAIPTITNNATLLSMLSKTSENTTSIGPTQLDVVTYHLAVPTPPYTSITVKYATIPGTNERLAVYLNETTTDGSETTVQITSLTR